jgi:hypothetical protein
VSDSTTDSSHEERLAISLLVALVGTVLALIIQMASGVGVVAGARRLRVGVAAMGITPAKRIGIGLRVAAPALLGVAAGAALIAVTAPQLGYPVAASSGWVWLWPLLAQAGVCLVVGGLLMRLPRR